MEDVGKVFEQNNLPARFWGLYTEPRHMKKAGGEVVGSLYPCACLLNTDAVIAEVVCSNMCLLRTVDGV